MNKSCCGCNNNTYGPTVRSAGAPTENPQITNVPEAMLNTFPRSTVIDSGTHFIRVDKQAKVKLFKQGLPLTNARYTKTTNRNDEWERQKGSLNLNLAYNDRQ
jgi:hypothetical protein